MKSFSTIVLASLTALASANKAILYENADCTGPSTEWVLESHKLELRRNWHSLNDAGWNDRGESVMVPKGYILTMWEHPGFKGTGLSYHGQENEDGSMVCQDIGVLKDVVSDSLFTFDLAQALQRQSQEIDSLKSENQELLRTISDLDDEIAEHNDEIAELNGLIAQHNDEIVGLNSVIEELDGE